ncbi:hypothetical protein V1264_007806 [Littorina saxatilis]|uniref:Uncharacterized protein n=1 Tax=Littorina saxatilis TaxID=31220 RepID=A0AAN9G3Q6_9CAEN
MHARCLFLFLLLISIAGRNLILSDDRVYQTSRRLNTLGKLNRRIRDIQYAHTRVKRPGWKGASEEEWEESDHPWGKW